MITKYKNNWQSFSYTNIKLFFNDLVTENLLSTFNLVGFLSKTYKTFFKFILLFTLFKKLIYLVLYYIH